MVDTQEILKLIEQAAKEGWTKLDLSGNQLASLPPECTQLTNLTSLFLNFKVAMNMKILTLVMLVMVGLCSPNLAQTREKAGDKLNRVVETLKQTEPRWKLHSNQPGGRHSIARWQSSVDYVVVSMFVYDTEAEAVAALFEDRKAMSNAPIPVPIKNVGDEAYLWNVNGKRIATIHFRKGMVMVIVNATSPKVAKDFAGHVLKQL